MVTSFKFRTINQAVYQNTKISRKHDLTGTARAVAWH